MVEKITDILINLEYLKGSPNVTLYNSSSQDFADNLFQSSRELSEHIDLSVGKKIQKALMRSDISIPSRIDSLVFYCDEQLFNLAHLDKFLLEFVLLSKCELTKWHVARKPQGNVFEAEFRNVNPYNLLGAMALAVKENSATLGKKAALLDIAALERVPQIAKYTALHSQQTV